MMFYDKADTLYLEWLLDQAFTAFYEPKEKYTELRNVLFLRKFKVLVTNDDNREMDGLRLRLEYNDSLSDEEASLSEGLAYSGCSVLEMMIALSRRLHFAYSREAYDCPARWFRTLCENLKISEYTNYRLKTAGNRAALTRKLNTLLDRTYGPSGKGSLFPMLHSEYDLSKTEIWYQMQYWIGENRNLVSDAILDWRKP